MEFNAWDRYYPRPQLRRDSFYPLDRGWTLNGRPIRLPWPPQAPLSGWRGAVGDVLWYETAFTLPEGFAPRGSRVLLHFGAVDQVAQAWLNGSPVVRHEGGYLPFCADITDMLRPGENRLEVKAVDTLSRDYPYGKQHKRPHGMWYTPVSGIWQSVWLEAAPIIIWRSLWGRESCSPPRGRAAGPSGWRCPAPISGPPATPISTP